ncbi:MAG: glycosyltransferase [Pseudomonadota bacterium]
MSTSGKQAEEQLLLLSDAIDRTVANPTASHCWLHLMERMRSVSRPDVLDEVLRALQSLIPDQGLSGYYLATFLDIATGDPKFLAKAVGFLKTITPQDPDRLAAFFHIAWQRALLYSNNRLSFTQTLSGIDLPYLSILIGNHLAKHVVVRPRARPIQQMSKVAIIAPQLTNPQHPPTQMALDQAVTLIQNDIEVSLFSCQETVGPDFVHLVGTGANNTPQAMSLAAWVKSVGTEPKIYASDQRFSLMRRWLDMSNSIEVFDPDLVIFVGLHSGLISSLYKNYPVLGLGTNSISPMVPTDVWLTAQARLADTISQPWGGSFPESQAWHHPYRVRRKVASGVFPWDSLGLSQGTIVLASIGGHLDVSISGMWAERMRAVMDKHPELVWAIVGGEGLLPPALESLSQDRLRLIPYTSQVLSLLGNCHIYLNPPAMGGGFAVAEAMSVGLPVLSFAESDGGDKVGSAAIVGMDEYFDWLEALIKDPDLRTKAGKEMQERFDRALDLDLAGPSLLAACELAIERYNQRAILATS